MPEVKIVRVLESDSYDSCNDSFKKIALEGLTNWDTVSSSQLTSLSWFISNKNASKMYNDKDFYILLVKDEFSISETLRDVKHWLEEAEKEKKLYEEKERKRKEKLALKKADKKQKELALLESLKKKYEKEDQIKGD